CRCFTDEPPCTEALKLFTPVMKKFAPKCDEDGFYQPLQCNKGKCWCVDRFNQEVEGTRAEGLVECPDNTDPNEVVFTGELQEGNEEWK
ncbi:thyroglobulin type-1 repeat-containing protein, partial [Salmonella sp. s51933]|uniref:thyroglobulin type-1 repeat-containing protein n=1 Tax=Salmonella sp. s51933 TaxID=3160127 RepID=UPI0037551414